MLEELIDALGRLERARRALDESKPNGSRRTVNLIGQALLTLGAVLVGAIASTFGAIIVGEQNDAESGKKCCVRL